MGSESQYRLSFDLIFFLFSATKSAGLGEPLPFPAVGYESPFSVSSMRQAAHESGRNMRLKIVYSFLPFFNGVRVKDA